MSERENAEVGSSCWGFPPVDVFPLLFSLFFLPQRNHAGLIADSLPIPSAASLLQTVNAASAAAAAPLSCVPPAVPRCQAAEDWQRPDTGAEVEGAERKI